jgi:SAM-dependent methyltransferase
VIAVEPSAAMIAQRAPDAAPVRQGVAEALPLDDGSVDAALAVSTLHHWADVSAGLRELRRVARKRIVIFTWDTGYAGTFWLTRDYLPEIDEWTVAQLPQLEAIRAELGSVETRRLPIPRLCRDGFLRAFWGRPEAYLDAGVRSSISQFNLVDPDALARGIGRLGDDLASGEWDRRHGELRARDELDVGYVLLVASLA